MASRIEQTIEKSCKLSSTCNFLENGSSFFVSKTGSENLILLSGSRAPFPLHLSNIGGSSPVQKYQNVLLYRFRGAKSTFLKAESINTHITLFWAN